MRGRPGFLRVEKIERPSRAPRRCPTAYAIHVPGAGTAVDAAVNVAVDAAAQYYELHSS
jgi:hypothetical protein